MGFVSYPQNATEIFVFKQNFAKDILFWQNFELIKLMNENPTIRNAQNLKQF